MRLLYLALLLAALSIGKASADDAGERLFQMFDGTCAKKPVSGEALDRFARSLGYVHQDGPVAPDDQKRDFDDINFWKLPDQGSNFAIDAYFAGPRAHYQVSCSIHANAVDAATFLEILNRETRLPDPQSTKSNPDTGARIYTWTAQADGAIDTLEVAAFKNGILSVAFSYFVIAR